MSSDTHFDYIIIGNGLAGLQLAIAFTSDEFFKNKSIALIDSVEKKINDKTWSFWEKNSKKWNSITYKTWNKALFFSNSENLDFPLNEYTYKSIRSIDFYNWAFEKLKQQSNVYIVLDTISEIEEKENLIIKGINLNYSASHVFDSRIPKSFFSNSKHTLIHQHFKGYVIKTLNPCFKKNVFTMMDYRFQYKNTTSFIYVLPFSETEALIEYTFFTPKLVDETVYNYGIEKYIDKELNLLEYEIIETERGNIPMTDFKFWNYNTDRVTKIGTGGGWVKGSTGYSFKHTEKNVRTIIRNLKSDKNPSSNIIKEKYRFYDKIFLDVLYNNNEKGVWVFEQFYKKNTIEAIFQFLDEETSIFQELKIMRSLFSFAFIKSFFRVLFR